jgi:hypothetical protein
MPRKPRLFLLGATYHVYCRVARGDPLVCPTCGSEMKVIAFIAEHYVVDAILRHLAKTEARSPRGLPGAATLPATS